MGGSLPEAARIEEQLESARWSIEGQLESARWSHSPLCVFTGAHEPSSGEKGPLSPLASVSLPVPTSVACPWETPGWQESALQSHCPRPLPSPSSPEDTGVCPGQPGSAGWSDSSCSQGVEVLLWALGEAGG